MPDLTKESAEEVQNLFDEVWRLDETLRAERLARIQNDMLRADVEQLLAYAAEGEAILHPFLSALPITDQPAYDRLIGTTVSHFRIEARLGSGGMGVIYRARDLNLDRPVALKFLPPELTRNEEARERFVQEAKAASALDHPHICTVHEIGEAEDGQTFIAMACYEGETLKARIERGPLPFENAIRYAGQIAQGLAAAHAKGIVHRDVKPGNVIVIPASVETGFEDEVKLLDFGLAKLSDLSMTRVGSTLGTAAYMSPEQARGDGVDFRTDLWSLGVVLYEMLAGVQPFRGESVDAVIYAILHEEPVPIEERRPEIPRHVAILVRSLLSRAPGDRPDSASQVVAMLNGTVVPAMRRRCSPRRRWMAGGIGLGLLLAFSVAAMLFSGREEVVLNPKRVVVMPFEIRTGDPRIDVLGVMAADWVTQGLQETGLVDVVPTQEVSAVVEYLKSEGIPPGKWMRAVGRETSGGIIVSGSCYRPAVTIQCQVQIIDAKEGKIVQALAPLEGNDVTALMNELRNRIMTALSFRLDPRLAGQEGSTDRPPLPEAYDEYVKGIQSYLRIQEAMAGKEDIEVMMSHFERAASLDTTFLRAVLWLAKAHALVGNWDKRTKLLEKLERRRGELNAYDRAHLDFIETVHSGNTEGAYQAAHRMMEAAPGSQEAIRESALMAGRSRRHREALQLLSRLNVTGGVLRKWVDYDAYLTYNLHMVGEHDRELEVARKWHASDSTYRPVNAEARALAALGRGDEMLKVLDAAKSHLEAATYADALMMAGYELRAHRQDATEVWKRAYLAWDAAFAQALEDGKPMLYYYRLQTAWTLYHQERYSEAARMVQEMMDQLPQYELEQKDSELANRRTMTTGSLNFLHALLMVRTGNYRAAREMLDQRLNAPHEFPGELDFARMTYQWETSMLAAWLGNRELAMRLYPRAYWRDQWDHCRWIDEEPLWGYPPYEALHRSAN